MPIHIRLDGEAIELDEPVTIDRLLRDHDLSPEILSVMGDGRVISRGEYATRMVRDGEELVVVVQVGGG